MKEYARFLGRCFRLSFAGDWRYHAWMFFLTVLALVGLNAFARQFVLGMATTGLSDHVSWGVYISNFTFLVGLTAATVMLVIPVYFFRDRGLGNLVVLVELLAVASVVMCMLFVIVDTGRPDRFLHLVAEMTWDVVALGVCLLLNLHVWGYLTYRAYLRRRAGWILYVPFALLAVLWAVIIHTVTAYLYVGIGDRRYWDTIFTAPRFLAATFCVGSALLVLTLLVIRRVTTLEVADAAVRLLATITRIAITIDVVLLGGWLLSEFGTGTGPSWPVEYLFVGLGERSALAPWVWTAVALKCLGACLLWLGVSRRPRILALACGLCVAGTWLEKDVGLIIPAFVPTQLGELVEYAPTQNEILVCIGILGFGLLIYTILVRITVPVLAGQLTFDQSDQETGDPS